MSFRRQMSQRHNSPSGRGGQIALNRSVTESSKFFKFLRCGVVYKHNFKYNIAIHNPYFRQAAE